LSTRIMITIVGNCPGDSTFYTVILYTWMCSCITHCIYAVALFMLRLEMTRILNNELFA